MVSPPSHQRPARNRDSVVLRPFNAGDAGDREDHVLVVVVIAVDAKSGFSNESFLHDCLWLLFPLASLDIGDGNKAVSLIGIPCEIPNGYGWECVARRAEVFIGSYDLGETFHRKFYATGKFGKHCFSDGSQRSGAFEKELGSITRLETGEIGSARRALPKQTEQ